MKNMVTDECWDFQRSPVRTAKYATVRADRRPHLVPIWFNIDCETLVFTTWHKAVKAANLRRDPRICLSADDQVPPFSFVQLEGTVSLGTDPDQLLYWANRIGGRYMEQEHAEAYGNRNGVPDEILIRVTPIYLFGKKDVAGW
jgi:PPOX class probable F420-dependent enzyme